MSAVMTSRGSRRRSFSDTQHHDLGGFDESGDGFTDFELHFAGGFGGDDGVDDLAADGELDLAEEAIEFEFDDAADELVATADGAEHLAFGGVGAFGFVEQAVEFSLGDAVVTTGSFDGFDFAAVYPLFEGGVGNAETERGFAR